MYASQHCVTKQWTTKWPNIANVALLIVQNHGEYSYFLEFQGVQSSQSSPWISPSSTQASFQQQFHCNQRGLTQAREQTQLKRAYLPLQVAHQPWASAGGKTSISWKLRLRIKNFQEPEVGSLTDLIPAMTVLFADMTITLHMNRGSLFSCHAVMSLQLTKFAPLPAEAGC